MDSHLQASLHVGTLISWWFHTDQRSQSRVQALVSSLLLNTAKMSSRSFWSCYQRSSCNTSADLLPPRLSRGIVIAVVYIYIYHGCRAGLLSARRGRPVFHRAALMRCCANAVTAAGRAAEAEKPKALRLQLRKQDRRPRPGPARRIAFPSLVRRVAARVQSVT